MRFSIASCLLRTAPAVRRQRFHNVRALSEDPAIFENSLEKTLEEHRTVNRANLIRKVVPRSHSQLPDRPSSEKEPAKAAAQPESCESQSQDLPPARWDYKPLHKQLRKKPRTASRSKMIARLVDFRPKHGHVNVCPWITQPELQQCESFSDSHSQLDAEIRALSSYLTPAPTEEEAVDRVRGEIRKMVSKFLEPSEHLSVERTGLGMSHSMFNVNFYRKRPDGVSSQQHRDVSVRRFQQFKDQVLDIFDKSYLYRVGRLGGHQKLQAIVHVSTGIVFGLENSDTSSAQFEYIRAFNAEYPDLRPLCLVINTMLEAHELYIPAEALQVLVAAFLKMNHGRFRGDTSCAKAFVAFVHTFGIHQKGRLTSTGVSADPPCFFKADTVEEAIRDIGDGDKPAYLLGQSALCNTRKTARKKGNNRLAQALMVQAPGNYNKDLGSSFTETPRLREVLRKMYGTLRYDLHHWTPSEKHGNGITEASSILTKLFDVSFKGFEERRRHILNGTNDEQ
ncbi:uncharacterized protein BDV17DRAFT_273910 [Aspergillus undulatus]|uniref:uncharacterized protein n=1 Tax=Aspergillus undulatus TaxID=1810928 RepID=UPI003CCD4147